jgi:hypothetical protein
MAGQDEPTTLPFFICSTDRQTITKGKTLMCAFRTGKARRLSYRFVVSCLLFGLLLLASGRRAKADTYVVINFKDSGAGSLRQAILNANSHAGADTIVFALAGNNAIVLSTALPIITDDVEIDGPGAGVFAIAATLLPNPRFSALQIGSYTGTGAGPTVSISGLSFIGGQSSEGGAINNVRGNVTVRNCEIRNNNGNNFGSGVTNAGIMVLLGCSISKNQTDESGTQANASRFGGGIYNTGTLSMTNCTVSGNTIHTLESALGQNVSQGGGIYNAGSLHVFHCTIADNQTVVGFSTPLVGQGGGIYNTGALTIDDTILQDSSSTAGISNGGGSLVNVSGTVVSQGYNLSNDSANGLLTGPGDRSNIDPMLGPLQNNGGDTNTRALLQGSPAIDTGDPAFTSPPATDQRGRPRVIGPRTDIGAVEYRSPFDFSGDGLNDLLFQNSQTGQIVAWSLNGISVQGGFLFNSVPDPGWKVVGSGDFNADGSPDLVFQNTTTKQIVVWYMNGPVRIGGEAILPPAGPLYNVVGVSDFLNNGAPDLVLQDSVTGQIVIWYMNGAKVVNTFNVPSIPAPGYQVVGVGDFNRDGHADLLFQNVVTGQLVVWYMNGLTRLGGSSLARYPYSGWQVKGVADYNNDGYPDIVFQNAATGKVVVWFMNGLTFLGGDLTTTQPLAPYQVVGPR